MINEISTADKEKSGINTDSSKKSAKILKFLIKSPLIPSDSLTVIQTAKTLRG